MKYIYILLFLNLSWSFAQTAVFINEIHYDNASSDVGEGFEIAGPAGTDLSTYTVTKYNGSNNSVYGDISLSGVIPDQSGGYGVIWFGLSTNGLQNGAPDGLALDNNGTLIQFLTYEGSIVASDGPAVGVTSEDIGVSETGSTSVGESLQLIGSGTTYEDFRWNGPSANTNDAINTGQSFGVVTDPTLSISNPTNNTTFYTAQLNVTISVDNFSVANGEGDGHIHYSLDGGPQVMKYDTNPIALTDLSEGNHVLVVSLVDNSHNALDPAVQATLNFTVDLPVQVSNINALRQSNLGEAIEVVGEAFLTYKQSFRNAKVFQDATAGIYVDDSDGVITTSYELGDGVTGITGTLSDYNGLLQFTPLSDPGVASSSANVVDPVTLTLAQLTASGENYESQLVKVEDVIISGDSGETTFINGKTYTLTNGSDTFPLRTTFYNFNGEDLPTSASDFEGIINERSGVGLHLAPRSFSDVTLSVMSFNVTQLNIYPNPTETTLNFSGLNAPVQATVFDMLGKLHLQSEVTNSLDVSALKSGLYMIEIKNETSSKVFKMLKQ
ncbi:MAG: T9SS type A sorting domain-containing protein [Flavobacteriaceae bacterium]